ncbi:MAG TPA: rhodanese-related sulfurtransferase [Alphaproteobacteria bacterium]|nr:rhodanese-related sulfurtransferase [Alphaproteobacteria bacterium]
MSKIFVAALYQFIPFPDFREVQPRLKSLCDQEKIKGILLLADEGINGTVAGSREAIDKLRSYLQTRFNALEYKESWADEMPFHRMKVRLKKEIVTLGVPGVNPCEKVGTYVAPEDWNDLISDPEVLLIDTRNDYEVKIGSFKKAVNPATPSFTDFPEFVQTLDKSKHKRVAMYCTGGIRCEKASSYLLSQGFENVYHLKGGILKYLETVPSEKSLWEGECFVFDNRVAVSHGLNLGHFKTCYGCRQPISEDDIASPFYERGVSCPHCYTTLTPEKRNSVRQRQRQEDLARARGEKHIGATIRKAS